MWRDSNKTAARPLDHASIVDDGGESAVFHKTESRDSAVGQAPWPETNSIDDLVSRIRNTLPNFSERGAPRARRDDREYSAYSREEQRRHRGCPARKMATYF